MLRSFDGLTILAEIKTSPMLHLLHDEFDDGLEILVCKGTSSSSAVVEEAPRGHT